jgi:cell wall-associated NlpC family hydrolase
MFSRTFWLLVVIGAIVGCASRGPALPAPGEPEAGLAGAASSEIALFALGQLGVPYAFGGTSPELGFDCSGLVHYVFRRARNMELPRTTYELARVGHRVNGPALQPGDLLFFNTLRREFSHVGIYLGDERFIHAPAAGGVVRIESMRADYWSRRFNGARRVAI